MLNRKGFTLIELLIVVVIIGILAAIAIPKFSNTKEKAYMAAMKSDLRNLVTAEEAFFADNTTYTTDKALLNYTESSGVTVTVTVGAGPPVGYSALTAHTGTAETCAMWCSLSTSPRRLGPTLFRRTRPWKNPGTSVVAAVVSDRTRCMTSSTRPSTERSRCSPTSMAASGR